MMRTEHPRPQFMRDSWTNLNGDWQFSIDRGGSGEERGLFKDSVTLDMTINVPFCPESKLSGIADVDFMNSVWYKRTFTLTEKELSGMFIPNKKSLNKSVKSMLLWAGNAV